MKKDVIEIIILCLPYWIPVAAIFSVALIGRLFKIKAIKEALKF